MFTVCWLRTRRSSSKHIKIAFVKTNIACSTLKCIDFPLCIRIKLYIFHYRRQWRMSLCVWIRLLLDFCVYNVYFCCTWRFDSQCHKNQMNQRPNKHKCDILFSLNWSHWNNMHHYIIVKYNDTIFVLIALWITHLFSAMHNKHVPICVFFFFNNYQKMTM